MRPRHHLAGVLAVVLLVAVAPAEGGKKNKPKKNTLARPHAMGTLDGPVTLENVNARWTGAATQTRVNIPIQKGKSQGWSSSEWLGAESEVLKMRFSVSPRDKLAEALPKKNLLAGVTMVCDGWSVRKPKKGKGVIVDFRFVNFPARARAEFDTDIEHLADVERFLRANVLGVTRYAQAASQGPLPTPASTTVRPLPAVETHLAEATSYPAPRGLRITGVQVQPASPQRGQEVELQISYEVSAGDSSIVSVYESRTLRQGESEIASLDEVFDRAPGHYTSSMRLDVPSDATPGFYDFQASVSFEDLTDRFSALFEVR